MLYLESEVLRGYQKVRMNKSLIEINRHPSLSSSFDLALFILK